jgi:hypothetical protein
MFALIRVSRQPASPRPRARTFDGCVALRQLTSSCPCEPQPVTPPYTDAEKREMDKLIQDTR